MRQTLFLFLFVFLTTQTYSQTDEDERYYPENPLFKKLQVKSVLDTIASPEFHHYKKEYDRLGRQTSWCYVEDSVVTRFRYVKSGDTLIKYHYYTKGGLEHNVYQHEKFVYNEKGKILTYQSCYDNKDKTSECIMEKFFYDDNNRLTSKLIYMDSKYKFPFSDTIRLVDSLINLVSVLSYNYAKNGNLLLRRQMIGKAEDRGIDSFYYDRANKLVKIVSRKKLGSLGEFVVWNYCWTRTFSYEKDRQTEKSSLAYSDGDNEKIKTTYREVNEYVFYPNGLKWMWYYKVGDFQKSRLDYLVYDFHK